MNGGSGITIHWVHTGPTQLPTKLHHRITGANDSTDPAGSVLRLRAQEMRQLCYRDMFLY